MKEECSASSASLCPKIEWSSYDLLRALVLTKQQLCGLQYKEDSNEWLYNNVPLSEDMEGTVRLYDLGQDMLADYWIVAGQRNQVATFLEAPLAIWEAVAVLQAARNVGYISLKDVSAICNETPYRVRVWARNGHLVSTSSLTVYTFDSFFTQLLGRQEWLPNPVP